MRGAVLLKNVRVSERKKHLALAQGGLFGYGPVSCELEKKQNLKFIFRLCYDTKRKKVVY